MVSKPRRPVVTLSELLLTGEVAGFCQGDSYPAMIESLGEPSWGGSVPGNPHEGYGYGDLEVFFEGRGADRGCAQLVYFNHLGKKGDRIRLRSTAFRFDPEGLVWGVRAEDFCSWMLRKQLPFSYKRDPEGEKLRESIVIDLDGDGRQVCFYTWEDGEQSLSEIYFARRRIA